MSSDGDLVVFENSVSPEHDTMLFNDKKYNFITDSTSNGGTFPSGQIQFDLSSFSSQQFVNITEAVIEFPVKITAQVTTAGAGGTPANATAGVLSAICKNGFHQWINSAQLIINGQTIQSQQPYENVAASYRILSNWSQDTLNKWGKSCGVALDDCTGSSETNTAYASNIGLNNAPYSTVATNVKGFDSTNNQTILFNKGVVDRAQSLNSDIASSTVGGTILGAPAYKQSGKSNVGSTGSNTPNAYIYSQFIMATVRVKDMYDIDQFPMVKNLKGYMYLTFNSFQTQLTSTSGGALGSVSYTPLTGLTCPYTINNTSLSGIILGGSGLATNQVVTVIGTVDASNTGAVGSAGPLLTNARLIMPIYYPNPKTDSALSKITKFKTLEKIVNPFTMVAGEVKNFPITVGVSNPVKLVLLPMWQNLGGATNLSNPEQSAYDMTPATSGPFAKLDNLQVYVANKPLFQYPIQYDYEFWISNGVRSGTGDGFIDETSSGLLSQQLWEQNHRYYCINLKRASDVDNGMSRSVQITCTNPSTTFGMKVIAILFYEKQWEINTATCQIQSA